MNAAVDHYEGQECDYQIRNRNSNSSTNRGGFKSFNRPTYARSRGQGPRQHNGMHRRRRKKIQW
jgi:hypothetical protein